MKCYREAEYVTRGVVRMGSDPNELGLSISSPLHPQGADIWRTCRVGLLGATKNMRWDFAILFLQGLQELLPFCVGYFKFDQFGKPQ